MQGNANCTTHVECEGALYCIANACACRPIYGTTMGDDVVSQWCTKLTADAAWMILSRCGSMAVSLIGLGWACHASCALIRAGGDVCKSMRFMSVSCCVVSAASLAMTQIVCLAFQPGGCMSKLAFHLATNALN